MLRWLLPAERFFVSGEQSLRSAVESSSGSKEYSFRMKKFARAEPCFSVGVQCFVIAERGSSGRAGGVRHGRLENMHFTPLRAGARLPSSRAGRWGCLRRRERASNLNFLRAQADWWGPDRSRAVLAHRTPGRWRDPPGGPKIGKRSGSTAGLPRRSPEGEGGRGTFSPKAKKWRRRELNPRPMPTHQPRLHA